MSETLTHSETDLRYPIGPFKGVSSLTALTAAERESAIESLAATPMRLRAAVLGLSPEQFETRYRPGGWTVRQVVHHIADSHMNSLIRFKLALTEDSPVVKGYDEALWAELEDSRSTPIEVSLSLIEGIHDRLVRLLRAMKPEDFARKLTTPASGLISLDALLSLYHWHGRHHIAHITQLRERMNWA